MKLLIEKLDKSAKMPAYAMPGDAGMDVFVNEEKTLKPGERYLFSTGIKIAVPEGHVALVWDKSGLASKQGLTTLGGVIEWSYRGEYKLILHNTSDQPYDVKKGDKLAQMLIQSVESVTIEEVEKLSDTERGSGGFGSTGR